GLRRRRRRFEHHAGKADPNAATKKGLTVGFLPKQVNNPPYFSTADKGGRAAVEELGSTFKEVGTSSGTDTSGQVSYVNTLTQQQVDAIAVSAQDPGALCTALKQAMKNGIAVVTYDSDTKPGCRNAFVSQASAEDLGRTEVQLLAEQIGYKGEIAILSAAQTATNQNTWIDYMKEELKDPQVQGHQAGQDRLRQRRRPAVLPADAGPPPGAPEPEGGSSPPTTVGIKAAAQYLSGSKYKGKVRLTGLGTPQRHAQVRQERHRRGVRAVGPRQARRPRRPHRGRSRLRADHRQGGGETFKAGTTTFTIGKDGVINLGKPPSSTRRTSTASRSDTQLPPALPRRSR
ncbi:substrate-binding domain-containing protein, partial [Streptomyces sp. SID7803]|nr:substrate-binding domain-containing protein [Streptomyces sp. SID7803]